MSANFSIDNDEIANLLRECNAFLSESGIELEPNGIATTSKNTNVLETLRGQVDTICENITSETNDMTATVNYEQYSVINDIILNDENVECIQIEDGAINNLKNLTDNNESQNDIIFVGSSSIRASIPVIDLCSSVTPKAPRKPKAILSNVEIIEIDEKNSSPPLVSSLTRKIDLKSVATDDKLQPKIQCAICLDSALKRIPTTTTCGHIFCNKCIVLALKSFGKCPLCKTKRPKLIKLYGINC